MKYQSIFILFFVAILLSSCKIYNVKTITPENVQNDWKNTIFWNKSRNYNAVLVNDKEKFIVPTLNPAKDDSIEVRLVSDTRDYKILNYPSMKNFRSGALNEEDKNTTFFFVNQEVNEETRFITGSMIDSLKYSKSNKVVNALLNTGLIVVGIPVFARIICNCPRVYSGDGSGEKFEGTVLTGAIAKSLERTDQLVLSSNIFSDGNSSITLKNELPETEYLDWVSIGRTKELEGHDLLFTNENNPIWVRKEFIETPLKAKNGYNIAVTEAVVKSDNLDFSFDIQDDISKLNTLSLTFENPKQDEVMLYLKGKQSKWLEYSAEHYFRLFGKRFDNLNRHLDNMESAEKYNSGLQKFGVSLNAYIRTNQGLKKIGSFENAGATSQKEMLMRLDLSEVKDKTIEIVLESAYKFWEIDKVGLIKEWNMPEDFESVRIDEIRDQDNNMINNQLSAIDQKYHTLNREDNWIKIKPEVVEPGYRYIIKAHGYYHHEREYENKMKIRALRQLKKADHPAHLMSLSLNYLKSEDQITLLK